VKSNGVYVLECYQHFYTYGKQRPMSLTGKRVGGTRRIAERASDCVHCRCIGQWSSVACCIWCGSIIVVVVQSSSAWEHVYTVLHVAGN